jgi:Activator of Hsp90 ATPase homolog 1-like protein
MAVVTTYIDVAPSDVYSVLANGWYYSGWVVGTSHMQAVEGAWPAVGSRLFHSSGVWPLALADETSVDEVSANERLVMTARGRPFGEARIEITLTVEGNGTRVALAETPISGPASWLHNRVADLILHRRNVESLARLTAMSERRTAPPSPHSECTR